MGQEDKREQEDLGEWEVIGDSLDYQVSEDSLEEGALKELKDLMEPQGNPCVLIVELLVI